MDKQQKYVLVTGASRGLGLTISRKLLDSGFAVVGVSRSLNSAIAEFDSADGKRHFYFEAFDLNSVKEIQSFVHGLHKRYGRFFGLVNNAGIGLDGLLATMHEREIQSLINVNLLAPILLCKYLSRGMLANRTGRIVNISSIIGSTGFSGLSVYGATKAGLHGLTKSLSRELGKAGISVNTVSPGYLETSMTGELDDARLQSIRRRSPYNRFPTTDEVANVVDFLMSPAASGVHGTNLTVDLGSTA